MGTLNRHELLHISTNLRPVEICTLNPTRGSKHARLKLAFGCLVRSVLCFTLPRLLSGMVNISFHCLERMGHILDDIYQNAIS